MASKPPGTVKEKKKNSSDWKASLSCCWIIVPIAFLVLEWTRGLFYTRTRKRGYFGLWIEGNWRPAIFLNFIHPDYAEDAKTFFRELAADIAGRKIKELRVKRRMARTDGLRLRYQCVAQSFCKGIYYQYRDTTGKDQAEPNAGLLLQELIAITAEANDYNLRLMHRLLWPSFDADGRIKYVNDTFCKLSQFSREEVIGHNPRIFNSGYHSKEFFKELWDTVLAGKIWGRNAKPKKTRRLLLGNTTIVLF